MTVLGRLLVSLFVFSASGRLDAQTIRVGEAAVNWVLPARGSLVCTYYQPIELKSFSAHKSTVTVCSGSSLTSGTFWRWRRAGDAVSGSTARGRMPLMFWDVPPTPTSYYSQLHAISLGYQDVYTSSGATPSSVNAGRMDAVIQRGGGSSSGVMVVRGTGPNTGPHHGDQLNMLTLRTSYDRSGSEWPLFMAGTPDLGCSGLTLPLGPAPTSTVWEIWISPRYCLADTAGSPTIRGTISASSDEFTEESSAAFLWVRYEVVSGIALFAEGGGPSPDCCEEIIERLDTIAGYMGLLWSSWIEDFLPKWVSQDTFLRTVLAGILESLQELPDPDSVEFGFPFEADLARTPSELVEGARSHGSSIAMSTGELGYSSESGPLVVAPVWTFSVPRNIGAGFFGGSSSGDHVFSVDFSGIPGVGIVVTGIKLFIMWTLTLWGVGRVWDEFRKYG